MSGIFNGINIGLKALQAQRKALDVTGHNIANANNDGYTRQRAVQSASEPQPVSGLNAPGGAGQMGTGVEIEEIQRIRDQFIDQQLREESQDRGYWQKFSQGLKRIEYTFNEPGDSSLNNAIGSFWQSLQDLSNHPEDSATRSTVRQRGQVLVDTFHTLHNQLMDYKRSLNNDVASQVEKINSITTRIADLNEQITAVVSSNQQPNDLMDRRDGLFAELNELVNVQGRVNDKGSLNISLKGVELVNGNDARELAIEVRQNDDYKYEDKVIFAETDREADIESGELKGTLDIRDREIDIYIEHLDNLAQGLHDRFNRVHKMGYDLNGDQGNEFFTIGDGAEHASAGIDLTDVIKSEDGINKIAAGNYSDRPGIVTAWNQGADSSNDYRVEITKGSGTDYHYKIYLNGAASPTYEGDINKNEILAIDEDNPGSEDIISDQDNYPEALGSDYPDDELFLYIRQTGEARISLEGNIGSGSNGIALADSIKKDKLPVLEDTTIENYYEAVISALGVNSQRAEQMVNNQEALVGQLENQRKSISGVSLDEEMANMIKYQQAYNAAAKVITRSERMMDILMNMVQ